MVRYKGALLYSFHRIYLSSRHFYRTLSKFQRRSVVRRIKLLDWKDVSGDLLWIVLLLWLELFELCSRRMQRTQQVGILFFFK